ncbi:MAG TPA: flagellar motor protein MotA, partial [Rhodospirillaceae bacterium]|nr:flagellar motor protein MotA [Rhodospirillaceae bacterium]
MTRPAKYLIRMMLFLAIIVAGIALLAPSLFEAFMANPVLNGIIVGALIIGIGHSFRSAAMLQREVVWIESFQRDGPVTSSVAEPRLLASMASMLGERMAGRLSLSTMALRTLLDGIATRLDEIRETSRYMIGLLVFLGLLGTFWGLLQTIDSVGEVIGGLAVSGENTADFFEKLKSGLKAPLAGMGTAFSSSLFGLAGSLILGFLALQVGQAQNRFYNELEDWLSGQTRLGSGLLGGESDQTVPAFIQALLEQTADSLESLQRSLQK